MAPLRSCVLALTIAASLAASPCTAGVDHPNSDLPGMPLHGIAGAAECGMLCDANRACDTYVFISAGCQGPSESSQCYLKAGVPSPVTKPACYCSGSSSHGPPPPPPPPDAFRFTLANDAINASLGSRGLVRLSATSAASPLSISLDAWALIVDGILINSTTLPNPIAQQTVPRGAVTYTYAPISGGGGVSYSVVCTYSTPTVGAFIRKTLSVTSTASSVLVVNVAPWDTLTLVLPAGLVGSVYPTGATGTYGVFMRVADGTGVVAAAENPFLFPSATGAFFSNGALVHIDYTPQLLWNHTTPYDATVRPFVADAGLLGLYLLSPNAVPPSIEADKTSSRFKLTPPFLGTRATHSTDTCAGMLFEHEAAGGASLPAGIHMHRGVGGDPSWLNYAERDAFRALGEAAFMDAHSGAPPALRIHIPWTENDYQIDIANATQWPEYNRILQMLSHIGVDRILFAGGNSDVSTPSDAEDDWGWENVLWLGYGEQLREGKWAPGFPIAPSVERLITTSQDLGISALPYAYPILGFTGNMTDAPWLALDGKKLYSILSNRQFQDYLISTLVTFAHTMAANGAGWDYTYFWDSSSSAYAQWYGWRRILLSVRAQMSATAGAPHYVVDNRQASHEWSPWMWAAGSYAEPLQSDEQTTSWTAYVQDLHIDRGDGNRQREMSYDYAQSKLCQPSAMPGFMHHNTDRGDGRRTDLSIRDYDYYGASYTIISAIATGGLNAVVCDIPARDEGEFASFPTLAPDNRTVSVNFYQTWLTFAATHTSHMRALKMLPQPPAAGFIDGTYALLEGVGVIFLFNPNAAAMSTPLGLLVASPESLDVTCVAGESITIGELWPYAAAAILTVPCGADFSIALDGRSARVLTVAPSAPGDAAAAAATAASRASPIFVHNQPVIGMGYNSSFAGGALTGTVHVPAAVFAQLAARAAAYPVPWTANDAAIAWLNPSRLLLSIDVNRALDSTAIITATLAGVAVPVQPSWSCRNVKREMCFQGFFIDLSASGIEADTDFALVINLPPMPAGAFLGVHYDNVDTIYA